MRLGIFGGSFDPVHYGHLLLAEVCREQHQLDSVWFLPAATPPHKQKKAITPDKQRVEMLRLAIAGNEAFDVCTLEIDNGGVNYTADSLEAIAKKQPDAELFFLLGGDSLRDLPTWRDPGRILAAATVVLMQRPGVKFDFALLNDVATSQQVEQVKSHVVDAPLVDFSSTRIRQLCQNGHSIRYRTPRAVERFIETNNLYAAPE